MSRGRAGIAASSDGLTSRSAIFDYDVGSIGSRYFRRAIRALTIRDYDFDLMSRRQSLFVYGRAQPAQGLRDDALFVQCRYDDGYHIDAHSTLPEGF